VLEIVVKGLWKLRSSAAADGGRCPMSLIGVFHARSVLRSSAAADGGRCATFAVDWPSAGMLRSSAAADGGRCCSPSGCPGRPPVAILGRRGRRPLPLLDP